MDILVQLDGLLWRFGDVAPDAIAMAQDIRVVQSRLQARGDRLVPGLQLFLAPGDQLPPSGDKAARLARFSGFRPDELETVASFASLKAGPSDIVLTTCHDVARTARDRGAWTIRVTDEPSDHDVALPYPDVMRGIEERLRIPTARPMRAGVREGGLLAIRTGSGEAAYELALRAIGKDRSADWVLVDDVLVLYTEDADLDDELGALPDAERLSYGINKLALAFEQDGMAGGMLEVDGLRLRDVREDETESDSSGRLLPWADARRQQLRTCPAKIGHERIEPLVLNDAYAAHASAILRKGTGQDESAIRQVVTDIPGANVTPDTIPGAAGPLAVTWRSDSGRHTDSGISVLVYRGDFRHGASRAAALSCVVQIGRWLSKADERRHVVHYLVLDDDVPLDALLRDQLFVDEQHRVANIVEFRDMTDAAEPARITSRAAERPLPSKIEVAGGGWCQAPFDTDAYAPVAAALIDAVTGS